MQGDILKIKPHHTDAARAVYDLLAAEIKDAPGRFVVAIGGESGSGKSETAAELARLAGDDGVKAIVIQQDDYFVLPPKTNHRKRLEDFAWVGPGEVRLELLDEHLGRARDTSVNELEKPLSLFDEDKLTRETVPLAGVKLITVEGTYTTSLENVDRRVFIDRDFEATREARAERGRDALDEFSERILAREHAFISKLKDKADVIINEDYSVTAVRW
jgi:uridine kinase